MEALFFSSSEVSIVQELATGRLSLASGQASLDGGPLLVPRSAVAVLVQRILSMMQRTGIGFSLVCNLPRSNVTA